MLPILLSWSLVAAAQPKTGAGYKPQVVSEPTPVNSATSGAPPVLPSNPLPVGPQQPPYQPGAKSPHYGSKNWSEKLQDVLNNIKGQGEYFDGPSGANGEYFGPGVMQKCEQAPASAQQAFEQAKSFRAGCAYAQRGENQKIAVNDFSTRPSYMYIFDQAGQCLGKTMVAFGNGAGGAQIACSDNGTHLTPPGFHLTAIHHGGGTYGPNNSLKMVGLQGQGSVGRGVLVHASRAPGTSSTWGCAGVGYEAFNAVKKTLGYGALVYNYFPPQQMANGCRSQAGKNPGGSCAPDAGAPGIPEQSTGDGAPAITQLWWNTIEAAYALAFPTTRLRISKGTQISILRELEYSGTLEIEMVKEEAQGPNVVRPEDLIRALGFSESVKDFKKRLVRDSGVIYVLKRDLPLLWEEEIYRLQKKHK